MLQSYTFLGELASIFATFLGELSSIFATFLGELSVKSATFLGELYHPMRKIVESLRCEKRLSEK